MDTKMTEYLKARKSRKCEYVRMDSQVLSRADQPVVSILTTTATHAIATVTEDYFFSR